MMAEIVPRPKHGQFQLAKDQDLREFFSSLLEILNRTDKVSVSLHTVPLAICERRLESSLGVVLALFSQLYMKHQASKLF